MRWSLSITNLLPVLFFCGAFGLRAEIAATPVRQAGASLDTSLRNEADHAVRQAALWLAARQQPDGSWGESNRVRLTSIVLFALKVSSVTEYSGPCDRAALWLDSTATNRMDDLGTHAWRLLALTLALPETPGRAPFLRRLADRVPADGCGASAGDQTLWREAVAAAGMAQPPPPESDASNRLARAAAAWPPPLGCNRAAWQLARLINRAGNGQLLRGNEPLDWRAGLAKAVINSQRRDAGEGGYWEARNPDLRLAETAFGILALKEL